MKLLIVILTLFFAEVELQFSQNTGACRKAYENDTACDEVFIRCASSDESCPFIQNEGGVMMCLQRVSFEEEDCYFACHQTNPGKKNLNCVNSDDFPQGEVMGGEVVLGLRVNSTLSTST